MFLSTIILSLIGANRIVADTTKEIVEKYGYPFEEYKDIQSPDGYLLTLHRILYGRNMLDKTNISKPVFLLHGIFSSSVSFVFAGPNISIAYQLADCGYDVWLGNCRGTSYSTKHSIHSIHSSAFWNFTMDDLAMNDLRTSIDFVLDQAKQKQITYIGYSLGNTILGMLLCHRPEYNKKIKLYVGISPMLSLSKLYHPWVVSLAYFIPLYKVLGIDKIPPMIKTINNVIAFLCNINNNIMDTLCINLIQLVIGSEKYINKTAAEPIFHNVLEESSFKTYEHLAQIYFSGGQLKKFDYGISENIRIYGNALPPAYEINRIMVPTAIYYASCDWFISREDIAIVMKQLPNVIDDYLVPVDVFNHIDFIWTGNIKEILLNRIIKLIDSYYI